MSTSKSCAVTAAAVLMIFLCLLEGGAAHAQTHKSKTLTAPQIQAVILAVEDEIYDFGYQKQFYEVGSQPVHGMTRLPLYVQPELRDSEGTVIYKLMPYGEVIRNFHFNREGLAVLEGAPDGGFPPTQPDTLTLYMDDDNVCRWKHQWLRAHFDVMDAPPAQRVSEAMERQKQRVGYSTREAPPKELRHLPPRN